MKNIKAVKNSLKFKAEPKVGLLTVRIGVKKLVLPVEARMLQGGNHLFLSFGSSNEIYEIDGKNLKALGGDSDGTAAMTSLTPNKRKRKRGKRGAVEMPSDVASGLSKIPAGHKIVLGPDGKYRMVKMRTRSK